jgi:hypothetical protein
MSIGGILQVHLDSGTLVARYKFALKWVSLFYMLFPP